MRSPTSTTLTPTRRRCSRTLRSTMFKACGFVLEGEKVIINGSDKCCTVIGEVLVYTNYSKDGSTLAYYKSQ